MSHARGGDQRGGRDEDRSGSGIRLPSIAGFPVHISPTWFIVAALITVGFAPIARQRIDGIGAAAYLVSALFAVLLYASVLLHELSHALTGRALGLRVRGITLHLLGGYTEFDHDRPMPGRDFVVAVMGPLVSVVVGVAALVASTPVNEPIAEFLLIEIAIANLLVGGFNLLPALPLDGGHMLRAAVWRLTGNEFRGSVVAAFSGMALAGLVLVSPLFLERWLGPVGPLQMLWAFFIALFIGSGARQAYVVARLRSRLPRLDLRHLTRRAIPVDARTPLAEAVRLAGRSGASALVVVDSADRPIALVSEASLNAVPVERRPWVDVTSVSRALSPALTIDVSLAGEQVIQAMRRAPSTEYLVVEPNGDIYGVLSTSDVERVLTRASV